MSMTKLEHPILIGIVGAAQGIRGEVRVKPFTEDPMAIAEYGALYTADGRRFEVLDHRFAKTVVVVRFRGINDRNAAEALKGSSCSSTDPASMTRSWRRANISMPISRGWKPGTPRASSGATVSGVLDFGGGDLLELRDEGRKPVVIPFTLAAVPTVDLEAGRILVDPIAAGLIDTGE
jgi:16S rRNA processing protein RimM